MNFTNAVFGRRLLQNGRAPVNEMSSARPRRRRLLKPVLVVVVLALVFGWLLPQFVDYDEIWAAVSQLDALEGAILLALGLARVPTEALIYRAFLPGLTLRRGSEAYLSSNLAAQILPPPAPSVVQYGYFRGGGYPSDDAALAAAGSFLFPTVGRFALPFVALVVLVVTGEVTGTIWLAAGLSLGITALAGLAGYALLHSERSARRLGARLQRQLSWLLRKARRDPVDDAARKAVAFRAKALAVLRRGWRIGFAGVAVNLLLTYVILLAALRFVGVSAEELSAAEAFAAFAIAFWAGAVLPITGSGLGVVDAVLIALLVELGGADDDALVAAALLWRVFYSVLTLPIGAVTLSRFRKANPELLARGTTPAAA